MVPREADLLLAAHSLHQDPASLISDDIQTVVDPEQGTHIRPAGHRA